MTTLNPRQIVAELDKHIIGQDDAKRAVAIALRNRWRRARVDESLRAEITPKNILMIGPTGVGKTEIARRLARLAEAPFIKVEATKFTEVGYVGRDVESIIRDLVDVSIKMTREKAMQAVQEPAADAAEERILNILLPPARENDSSASESEDSSTRQRFRKMLREGKLDDKEVDIEVSMPSVGVEIMSPPGMEEMTSQLQNMFQSMGQKRSRNRRLPISEAMKILTEEEAARLINEDEIKLEAVSRAEQHGIVFIDELDKVTRRSDSGGPDVSREGVQRDLLPLVEGSTVNTRFGMIRTDHILFIASGAFHLSRPSDLIPELQGRLPIRVELSPLGTEDFVRILTEPDAALCQQYAALLDTEGVQLQFKDSAIRRIAEVAWQVNERSENIGARRLHTVMERLLETLSFSAGDETEGAYTIDAAYVDQHLTELSQDENLSRYIL